MMVIFKSDEANQQKSWDAKDGTLVACGKNLLYTHYNNIHYALFEVVILILIFLPLGFRRQGYQPRRFRCRSLRGWISIDRYWPLFLVVVPTSVFVKKKKKKQNGVINKAHFIIIHSTFSVQYDILYNII